VATLRFPALSNKTYTVEYTDNLGANPWSKFADVSTRGSNRVESVPDPAWRPSRFYRLVTPRQN
jgi:hypothetical protein